MVIKICKIIFIALPAVLYVIYRLIDGDKVVSLIVWIIIMFILAAVMLITGYFDSRLVRQLEVIRSGDEEPEPLRVLNPVGKIGKILMSEDAEDIIEEEMIKLGIIGQDGDAGADGEDEYDE